MDNLATIISIVSLVSAVCAIVFGCKNNRHTDIKDVEARVADSTRLEVKIDNILTNMDDIKGEIKGQRTDISNILIRLAEVESSSKQAHKRIDEIVKR